jgi:hypothetical protein
LFAADEGGLNLLRAVLVIESAGAQKLNRLPDDFAVAHNERMRRVNDDVIAHARKFGSFDGNFSIITAANQQAVDPIN